MLDTFDEIYTKLRDWGYPCKFCGSMHTTYCKKYPIIDGIIYLDQGECIIECKECFKSLHKMLDIRRLDEWRIYGVNQILHNWRSDYYKKVLALKADWHYLPDNIRRAIEDSIPLLEKREKEDMEWSRKQSEINLKKE